MAKPYSDLDWRNRNTIVRNSGLRSAEDYVYPGKGNTERQFCFYEILARMLKENGSSELPVVISGSGRWRMDAGCVKMAVDDGVIRPLRNAKSGYVETVELNLECLKTFVD